MAKKVDYNKLSTNKKEFQVESRKRTVRSWQKQDRAEKREKTFSILGIVAVILLVATVFSVLRGNQEQVTFRGFLEFLQTAPSLDLEWLNWSALNLGDWGIFNFLKEIINFLVSVINVFAFAGTMLVQAVMYILWFSKWLLL